MISALTGQLVRFGHSQFYINVNGIEYEVFAPLNILEKLQQQSLEKHKIITMQIYHHFRENEQELFGFFERREKAFFQALLKLRGVGTSLAMSLLSHLNSNQFLVLCNTKDSKALCRIPRIGKSIAESIIFEVNRRPKEWQKLLSPTSGKAQVQDTLEFNNEQDMALQALIQLGYKEQEAIYAIRKILKKREKKEEGTPSLPNAAEWIRAALHII